MEVKKIKKFLELLRITYIDFFKEGINRTALEYT